MDADLRGENWLRRANLSGVKLIEADLFGFRGAPECAQPRHTRIAILSRSAMQTAQATDAR
jgi:uncharacterized protein YjbI with pentapeptide repeats